MNPAALIARKRDGEEHTREEVQELIRLLMKGEMRDYQMTAWLMAAYLNGLSTAEMTALTEAMLHSGTILKHPGVTIPKIDKHSTGGVGDKLSLPLAPLVASAGLCVPMISGRGLGHTGGTLDKLESIPGYDCRLSPARFRATAKRVGATINGQTQDLAPADRKIYALRDVTGTVACRPLIVASILSKKLAAGLDGLVLDVKVGRGAFMKTPKDARALARSLTKVSTELGTRAVAVLTRMDAPLGRTIGNALEVRESIELLRGEGPPDVSELLLELGAEMLLLGEVTRTRREAMRKLAGELSSGRALSKFAQMIRAHGGDSRVIDDPKRLPRAPVQVPVLSEKNGIVTEIDSLQLALVALDLGAGRKHADDAIDHAVGIELLTQVGERVEAGQPLALLHQRSREGKPALRAGSAFSVTRRSSGAPKPLVLGRIKARTR